MPGPQPPVTTPDIEVGLQPMLSPQINGEDQEVGRRRGSSGTQPLLSPNTNPSNSTDSKTNDLLGFTSVTAPGRSELVLELINSRFKSGMDFPTRMDAEAAVHHALGMWRTG